MSVRIRLTRQGRKAAAYYHIDHVMVSSLRDWVVTILTQILLLLNLTSNGLFIGCKQVLSHLTPQNHSFRNKAF